VVTNIDADHMATYGGDFNRLKQAFVEFLHHLPFYGLAVLCLDDPVVREILPLVHKPLLTYGMSPEADVRASDIREDGLKMHFTVSLRGQDNWLKVTLSQPGRHNVQNALAAIAIAHELEVPQDAIARALANFSGIGRRFQINGIIKWGGDVQGRTSVAGDTTPGMEEVEQRKERLSRMSGATDVIFVDDYGHHPREIAVTVDAARRSWPGRRLVVVFQPHRYTRTHDLLDDFSAVLSEIEVLLVTEVYAAGEKPISGADGRALCRAIRARGKADPIFVPDVYTLPAVLNGIVRANDVVLTLGAGDIGKVAAALPQTLTVGGA
jgi:UDP-N-acetylmuramate--alanine ligase